MTKKILFILLLAVVIVILLFFYNYKKESKNSTENQVCFKNNCFLVELATTATERASGLMFRSSLAADHGMLFIFNQEDEYPFWMKNTLIPLDIIWFDQNQKVVFISADTPSCQPENCPSINPEKEAKYVLELNAGVAFKIGLSVGDKLSFILID